MKRIFECEVDLYKKDAIPYIALSEADVLTNELRIAVNVDDTAYDLADHTIKFYVKKPNGNVIVSDITTVNENIITILLTDTLTNLKGRYKAELHIVFGTETLNVCEFKYNVLESVSSVLPSFSDEEMNVLSDLVKRVKALEDGDLKQNDYIYLRDFVLNVDGRAFLNNGALQTQKKNGETWINY